ncbi:adenylosuccinate lyase [Candidatus Gracilibacteria bacterium]|nr:adenylosuccinate lyase [Candidatus Gracilibacteria bacterium]
MAQLFALSPLDGRYADKVQELSEFFSESGLQRYRVKVEIEWLIFICNDLKLAGTKKFSATQVKALRNIYEKFSDKDAQKIKDIEATTNHDVKAVEYLLRDKLTAAKIKGYESFIHFGCTSEDINNLSYAMMTQDAVKGPISKWFNELFASLEAFAEEHKSVSMMGHTHGQPASPTTVGKEVMNVVARLERQSDIFDDSIVFLGKINGAVGNYNAHVVAYPEIDWIKAGQKFISGLGLTPNMYTTQIEPHDWNAELFDLMRRVNVILTDFSRDMWMYIGMGYFKQKVKKGEVGSSTMPHKVNPIDFENAEGNFGLANALFGHFSEKLPISRMQRDLTDSTVMRNVGVAFGYTLLGFKSLLKGMNKVEVNKDVLARDLDSHWEVLGEPVQTVLRKYGVKNAYELLKDMTRGKDFGKADYVKFVTSLPIPPKEKSKLEKLTPASYIGLAVKLV